MHMNSQHREHTPGITQTRQSPVIQRTHSMYIDMRIRCQLFHAQVAIINHFTHTAYNR